MTWHIRPTTSADGPKLPAIEIRAGEQFRDTKYAAVADHAPTSVDELTAYARAGRSWVAVEGDDDPIGYVVVDVIDGLAHIEQVSVLPEHQGRGIGRGLIDAAEQWARGAGRPALTLTTFTDVAWNAPLYRRLGFTVLAEPDIGPELRAVRAVEAAHGLDPATRVCMHKLLDL